MRHWSKQFFAVIALLALLPMGAFAMQGDSSTQMDHEMMSMQCDDGGDCQRQIQMECLEHCLELAEIFVGDVVVLKESQDSFLITVGSLQSQVESSKIFGSFLKQLPPPDPRYNFITVQRE